MIAPSKSMMWISLVLDSVILWCNIFLNTTERIDKINLCVLIRSLLAVMIVTSAVSSSLNSEMISLPSVVVVIIKEEDDDDDDLLFFDPPCMI